MTTAEFLFQLEANLHSLTAEERENALTYYREYLEEAGENAPAAIEALGSPQSVAQRIIAEVGGESPLASGASATNSGSTSYDSPYDTDKPTNSTSTGFRYVPPPYIAPSGKADPGMDAGRIILAIVVVLVTSPIWLTVLCLWASLVFSLAVTWLAFVFAAIAAPLQGAMHLRDGMTGSGLWDIGGGILCLGLALLLWYPFLKAIIGSSKGMFVLAKRMLFSILGKGDAA